MTMRNRMILAAMLSATGLLSTGPEHGADPDPEPSEPVGTPTGPKIDALLAMPDEMWTQRGAKKFDRAFAELAKTTASAIAHALPRVGFPDVLVPGMKIPSDAPAASLMLFWPCETRALQRPRLVVLELIDNHVAVDGLGWRAVVIYLGETRMKITHGASIDDVIRFLSDLRVQRQGEATAPPSIDPVRYLELWIAEHGGASEAVLRKVLDDAYGITTRGIEIGEHLPTRITGVLRESYDLPDGLTVLPEPSAHFATLFAKDADRYRLPGTIIDSLDDIPDRLSEPSVHLVRVGNSVGKTDMRGMLERMRAQGMLDDIPARAAEPYRPAHAPPRKVAYVPFYTPAEQAERAAQAKAKKAKRKNAQAAKRRNR